MKVVLDTNLYGWYIEYTTKGNKQPQATDSFDLISKIQQTKEVDVLATDTIAREIKDAKSPLLSEVFSLLVKGIIKKTKRVEEVASEYIQLCKRDKLHFVTIEDCEIIAATTIAGIKFLVTENRKTLNNPKVVEIIRKINTLKNSTSPRIVDAKNALGVIFV